MPSKGFHQESRIAAFLPVYPISMPDPHQERCIGEIRIELTMMLIQFERINQHDADERFIGYRMSQTILTVPMNITKGDLPVRGIARQETLIEVFLETFATVKAFTAVLPVRSSVMVTGFHVVFTSLARWSEWSNGGQEKQFDHRLWALILQALSHIGGRSGRI